MKMKILYNFLMQNLKAKFLLIYSFSVFVCFKLNFLFLYLMIISKQWFARITHALVFLF